MGDERTLRVHVHTDDPDAAVALFEAVGEVSRFDVADMHEQVAGRLARLSADTHPTGAPTCSVVAETSSVSRSISSITGSTRSWGCSWWTAAQP